MTVHKYQVPLGGRVEVPMPQGAEILCVQLQRGDPCVWARVRSDGDPPAKFVTRVFRWWFTGERGVHGKYVGTVQDPSQTLVFHLFVEEEPA